MDPLTLQKRHSMDSTSPDLDLASTPAATLPTPPPSSIYVESQWGGDSARDAETEHAFAALAAWRAAYRAHRRGGARGASGELARLAQALPAQALSLTPALQRARLTRRLESAGVVPRGGDTAAPASPSRHAQHAPTAVSSTADAPRLHVHVGAGKLGLGLVLPALAATRGTTRAARVVVVQRPSAAWIALADAPARSLVTLSTNGVAFARLAVARDAAETVAVALDAPAGDGVLLLSDDDDAIASIAARANSFSIAVGTAQIAQTLETLFPSRGDDDVVASPSAAAPRALFACENDHGAVEDAAAKHALCAIHGGDSSDDAAAIEIVPVLVDRICTTRVIVGGAAPRVDVATEPYGGALVVPPPREGEASSLAPFGGAALIEPETAEAATFLHRRKLLTVNGSHTTLAFMSLDAAQRALDAVGDSQALPIGGGDLPLCSPLADDDGIALGGREQTPARKFDRMLWSWCVARQLLLLDEFGVAVARHALVGDGSDDDATESGVVDALLSYAAETLARFACASSDTTSRVLGGGVRSRFATRLRVVDDFLRGSAPLRAAAAADASGSESDGDDTAAGLRVARALLARAGVTEAAVRNDVSSLVARATRFVPLEDGRLPPAPQAPPAARAAVLFDFDGTLGDTEAPAMDVAFWELAPFMPSLATADAAALEATRASFVVANAGKAFEHMCDVVDAERAAAGVAGGVEDAFAALAERTQLLETPLARAVDSERSSLGLEPLALLVARRAAAPSLLAQQKLDTNQRLAIAARATPGTIDALHALTHRRVPFNIATTSGKPRVPICVDAAGLRPWFASDDDDIHSGESDFTPPRFKPAPDVYLKAARGAARAPSACVAVEDSASGVGAAANARLGLIVGYVGASHIADAPAHAAMLMRGARADDGRGAELVIEHMADLPAVVAWFDGTLRQREHGRAGAPGSLPDDVAASLSGRFWTRKDDNGAVVATAARDGDGGDDDPKSAVHCHAA